MSRRVAQAAALVSVLTSPFVSAQVAQQAPWLGSARPAYPAPAYPTPTPAAYRYTPYPSYPNQGPQFGTPAPAYGTNTTPAYGSYSGTATGGQYPANYAWGSPTAARMSPPGGEAQGPLVPTMDNRHYIEMGMGAFIPTDRGNAPKLGLEASFKAFHGGWVPGSGLYLTIDASTGFDVGCLAKRAADGCKGHLRVHWLGTGPFFNTGTPMIASDVPRSWDLMALTGAEVRIWKGMTAKATVNWFLPNPWGVYAHEQALAEARLSAAAANPMTAAAGVQAEGSPMDRVASVLGHALTHPQLNLMAMWEF